MRRKVRKVFVYDKECCICKRIFPRQQGISNKMTLVFPDSHICFYCERTLKNFWCDK